MSATNKAVELLRLHTDAELLVLVNVWDVASARVVAAQPGCKALATASAAIAASFGYPDQEHIPLDLVLDMTARIVEATDLPVSADLEAGYGDVATTTARAIAAGVAGANLEDRMRALPEAVAAVQTAVNVAERDGVPLVLNARTDAYLLNAHRQPDVLADAIARGRAFLDAGASCVFVPGRLDAPTITELVGAFGHGKLSLLGVPGSPPPRDLAALGVARLSYGPYPQQVTLDALADHAAVLLSSAGLHLNAALPPPNSPSLPQANAPPQPGPVTTHVLRGVQGLVAATFAPAALAYVGEVLPASRRASAIAWISTAFLLAGILGQVFADWVAASLDWRWVFLLSAPAFLIFAAATARLPADRHASVDRPLAATYTAMARLLTDHRLVAAYVAATTVLLAFVAMYVGLGAHLATRGAAVSGDLLWARLVGVPGMLAAPLAGRLIPRYGPQRLASVGFAVGAIGLGLQAAAAGSVPWLVAASVLFVAGVAVVVPSLIALVGELAPQARGAATAVYAFVLFVGASLGPMVAVALREHGFATLCLTLAAAFAAAAALVAVGARPAHRPEQTS